MHAAWAEISRKTNKRREEINIFERQKDSNRKIGSFLLELQNVSSKMWVLAEVKDPSIFKLLPNS